MLTQFRIGPGDTQLCTNNVISIASHSHQLSKIAGQTKFTVYSFLFCACMSADGHYSDFKPVKRARKAMLKP